MTQGLLARARQQRGNALIETAFVMPLLLLVSISVFEFGRAFQYWQVLTNAAREGARIAVLPGTSDDEVTTRVQTYLSSGQLSRSGSATIAVDRNDEISIGADTAPASTIVVSYPFEFIVLQPVAQLVVGDSTVGEALTMTASSTMRNE